MSDSTFSCTEYDAGLRVYTFRLDPPVQRDGEVMSAVLVRMERGEAQVWHKDRRLICFGQFGGGDFDPGLAVQQWCGYTETAESALRRALGVYGEVPVATGAGGWWRRLSTEAKLSALLVARHYERMHRFPPSADMRNARDALRRLDRTLSDLLGDYGEGDEDDE